MVRVRGAGEAGSRHSQVGRPVAAGCSTRPRRRGGHSPPYDSGNKPVKEEQPPRPDTASGRA